MIKITVDCEENDSFDIKCGGASILGYDFYVETKEGMEDFIREELKKNNQPCLSISFSEVNLTTKAWTKEMISECIKNGY